MFKRSLLTIGSWCSSTPVLPLFGDQTGRQTLGPHNLQQFKQADGLGEVYNKSREVGRAAERGRRPVISVSGVNHGRNTQNRFTGSVVERQEKSSGPTRGQGQRRAPQAEPRSLPALQRLRHRAALGLRTPGVDGSGGGMAVRDRRLAPFDPWD
jgi:hypothetical protein